MGIPIGTVIEGALRLGELVKRLIEQGRTEATEEEMEAATQRRKGALSDLEAELKRRKAGGTP